jgi:hypothetical protein
MGFLGFSSPPTTCAYIQCIFPPPELFMALNNFLIYFCVLWKREREKKNRFCRALIFLSASLNITRTEKTFLLPTRARSLIIAKCLFQFSLKNFSSRICNFCCDITISPPNKGQFDLCAYVHSWSVIINIEIEFICIVV